MPTYVIERNVGDLSTEQLEAAARKSNEVLAQMEGVIWIRSYVSHADGKIFCEYEAPSADHIREHARRAGLPADKITEISITISPDMFR
jgi:Nickel responsive protein SCO4226-like